MPKLIATVFMSVSPRLPDWNFQSSGEVGWQEIVCHWEMEMACISASVRWAGVADFDLSSTFHIKIWS